MFLAPVRCLALDQLEEDVVGHAVGRGATAARARELPIGLAAPAATALDLLCPAKHRSSLATTAAALVVRRFCREELTVVVRVTHTDRASRPIEDLLKQLLVGLTPRRYLVHGGDTGALLVLTCLGLWLLNLLLLLVLLLDLLLGLFDRDLV